MKKLSTKEYPVAFEDTKKDGKVSRTVTAGLLKLKGNKNAYFSFTVWGPGGSGGCDHETIARLWPDLIPFLPLHLSDENGKPMHAYENGRYWLGMTEFKDVLNFDTAAKHFRDTPETMKEIWRRTLDGEINLLSEYVEGQKDRWKKEADDCINYIKSLDAK